MSTAPKSDEDCSNSNADEEEPENHCVVSKEFSDYHSCEPMPRRCSNHKECGPQEECLETLARGFNARAPEWSSRCTRIPFRRCVRGRQCEVDGYHCISHKQFGRVCVCFDHFGRKCHNDGHCPDNMVGRGHP